MAWETALSRSDLFNLTWGEIDLREGIIELRNGRAKTGKPQAVMDELGFDRETIAKVSNVPQRTVSDIANWKGCWASTREFNELRETYRLYL